MKSSPSDYYLEAYGGVVGRVTTVDVVQFVSAIHILLRVRSAIRHFFPFPYGCHLTSLFAVSVPGPQTESHSE